MARIDLDLLLGIERSRRTLLENTLRFAQGRPANNALLWGARGMGKSSLIKAVHAKIVEDGGLDRPLLLVELAREDIATVGRLLTHLAGLEANTLLFCDDCLSTTTMPPTSRSRPCSTAVSPGGRRTCCSTRLRTGATCSPEI